MTGPVVVAYDGSAPALDALALGRLLARLFEAPLVLACAYPPRSLTSRAEDGSFGTRDAERAMALLEAAPAPGAELRAVKASTPEAGLHQIAERDGASLLVVGSSVRHGLGRTLLGSTGVRALRNAPCPVALPPGGYGTGGARAPRLVGVAYDGSREARAALDVAIDLVRRARAELRVVRVVTGRNREEEARRTADEALAALPQDVRASVALPGGDAADALREASAGLDLLVMGSRGRAALGRLVAGSTSAAVLEGAACPVVVVTA